MSTITFRIPRIVSVASDPKLEKSIPVTSDISFTNIPTISFILSKITSNIPAIPPPPS